MPSACAPSDAAQAAATPPRRVVVLGIGNTLLADEGVGVHAARALGDLFVPPSGQGVQLSLL